MISKENQNSEFRLSNALEKIIKLEEKGEMKHVIGVLCDGNNGYCLSGALGHFFGIDKEYLCGNDQIHGIRKLYKAFGDAKFNDKCPLFYGIKQCQFHSTDIQDLLIHLNDDHYLSFTEAKEILEDMKL